MMVLTLWLFELYIACKARGKTQSESELAIFGQNLMMHIVHCENVFLHCGMIVFHPPYVCVCVCELIF